MKESQKNLNKLRANLDELRKEGLVDMKIHVFDKEDTTTAGVILVLNNALELRKQGTFKPVLID